MNAWTAFIVAMYLDHVTKAVNLFRVDKSCVYNYTIKYGQGDDTHRVVINEADCFYAKQPRYTRRFNISLLGHSSDEERILDITWDADAYLNASTMALTLTYGDPAVSSEKCLQFQVYPIKHQETVPSVKIRFDCVIITRGFIGTFEICEKRSGTVANCGQLKIDTERCRCPEAKPRVTKGDGGALVIDGSGMSRAMSMIIEVRKGEEPDTFFEGKFQMGNITTLYCLDYSSPRKKQECQKKQYVFETKPKVTKVTQKSTGYLVPLMVCISVIVVVAIGIVVVFKRWANLKEHCRKCWQYRAVRTDT